jgi:hypothetical protein
MIPYPHLQLFHVVWLARHIASGHQELAYFFFQSKGSQDRIRPLHVFIIFKPNVGLCTQVTSKKNQNQEKNHVSHIAKIVICLD